MISILFTISLCLFSVHVTECNVTETESVTETEIQLTTFVYNYDNFGDIFRQETIEDFKTYKYEDIDTGYVGPHIGGAFMVDGISHTSTNFYDGYIVDISTNHYCGNYNKSGGGTNGIKLFVYYLDYDTEYPTHVDTGYICWNYDWNYDYTWIPPSRFNYTDKFTVQIYSYAVAEDSPNGFDEIRITTSNIKF